MTDSDERFYIDCYGVIDKWKKGEGCEQKLTWLELADTLNQLNNLAKENLDEYKYIVEIEHENNELKKKLEDIEYWLYKQEENTEKIKEIIKDE